MSYQVKGRVVHNRPIHNAVPKRLPIERPVYVGAMLPRLRPKDGLTHAIGFTAKIVSEDED